MSDSEEIAKTFIDKSGWIPGEWQEEPDKVQWTDLDSGYVCLARRSAFSGALCGYVGINKLHPCYENDYDEVDVSVHGGLTFSGKCSGKPETGICRVTEDQDDVWWLGFDCSHGGDFSPAMESRLNKIYLDKDICSGYIGDMIGETYKNLDFVKHHCEGLAAQLKLIEVGVALNESKI